jgi:hypothetical protein
MSTVSDTARVTIADGAVWRTCTICGRLAALAPDIECCEACAEVAAPGPLTPVQRAAALPAEAFTTGDLNDICLAGCVFASVVADIAHHEVSCLGAWDCSGTPPEELARLLQALDRMAEGIRESRSRLSVVERRVRRAAARLARRGQR